MKSERPGLFKECGDCLKATGMIQSESESPSLLDVHRKFKSIKIELTCDVQSSNPGHKVFMTPWHVGRFSNDVLPNRRREGKTQKVECPHFKNEEIY